MNYKVLPSQLQFIEGDELWLFPQISLSRCLQNVDWYLNFQIMNSNITSSDPILVLSNNRLPTKAVLSANFNEDINSWLNQGLKYWHNLGSPSLRIFLPDGHKANDLDIINTTKSNINIVASPQA